MPSASERFRYLWGGRLPAHVEWVRHDLTDAGWRLRVFRRVAVQLLPVLVVGALLPLPALDRVLLVLLVAVAGLMTAATVADQLRDRRLRQHGLPVPEDPDEVFRRQHRY